MQFNYSNSANYLAGGAQVSNTLIDTYDTSQKTGTNVNKLVKAESTRRTQKRINAIDQVDTVGDVAVDIQTGMKLTDMDAKLKKDIAKIQKPAKMAGALAATVNLGNTGLMLHQDMKLSQKEAAERKEWRAEQTRIAKEGQAMTKADNEKTDAMLKRILESSGYSMDADGMPVLNPSAPSTSSNSSSNSSSTLVPITTSLSSVKAITPSGGNVDRQEVYTYLTKTHGLSKNKALGVMANIDRESTFRSNPAGGDGDNSFGMLQWNNTYGRSDLMKKNVPDFATNWKGQLDHALSQNQLPEYNQFISQFKNTTYKSPQAASEAFLRNWERPADVAGGIAKNNQFIAGYNYQ